MADSPSAPTSGSNATVVPRTQTTSSTPLWRSYELALGWLGDHRLPTGGIAVTDYELVPYPEVTGYIVPTLLDCGERELALDLARWLVSVQRPDGGFDGPDGLGASYLFDVGQVLRGFVATLELLPEVEEPLRRAVHWMLSTSDRNGVIRAEENGVWVRQYGGHISENIHIYTLPPLLEAGKRLGEQRWIEAAERSLAYYLAKPDLTRFNMLSHFYGYVLEALVDLGQIDRARAGLQDIVDAQWSDGGIPAVPGARWICSPGSLQLAIVGYKLGHIAFGNRALDYMQRQQQPSGGFQGSYGPGAAYGPHLQPSWACKYFLDACHWRMRATFDSQRERFVRTPQGEDPRIGAVMHALGDLSGRKVLDAGCGRGQFLRAIQQQAPTSELWGVDLAPELLKDLPEGVHGQPGSILNLPFPDATFDAVLCVEALEHVVRTARAIDELNRVLKPGGKLVIVDKNVQHLGVFQVESWEQWFDPGEVQRLLSDYCPDAASRELSLQIGHQLQPVLVVWTGTRSLKPFERSKRSAPTAAAEATSEQVLRYQQARERARARRLVDQGFSRYAQNDSRGARRLFLEAIRSDTSWLRNRGIISILVQSVIGDRAVRHARALLTGGRSRARQR